MKSCGLWIAAFAGGLVLSAGAAARPLDVPGSSLLWKDAKLTDLRARATKALGSLDGVTLIADDQTGTLRLLKGEALAHFEPTVDGLRGWLSAHKELLGLDDPTSELKVLRHTPATADFPWHYVRLRQQAVVHKGEPPVEVVERGLTALFDATGRLFQLTGNLIVTPSLDDRGGRPTRSFADTLDDAERFAGFTGEALFVPPPARTVVHSLGDRARIAHEHVVSYPRGASKTPYHKRLYVDATSGKVLGQRELIWTQQAANCEGNDWTGTNREIPCLEYNDGSRSMADAVTLDVTMQTTDAQQSDNMGGVAIFANGNTFNQTNAVSGTWGIKTSYDYMQSVLGRPSWNHDGGGSDLGQFTTVNYGFQYPNAFATVVQVQSGQYASLSVFGNGDGFNLTEMTRCIDVAGHELTHNVVASTAGLVYENQPGALNEHFADAFGTAIDKHYENNDDAMGENCTPSGAGIRNMANPNLHGQPDHMNQYQNLPNNENGDYGGVHINSGIPNKAFFEVYDQLGIETAEQVWYRALNQGGLGDRAQFLDFANAIATSCSALGLPGGDCDTVVGALSGVGLQVEVGGGGQCPPNSSPSANGCVCDAGYQPNAAGTACEVIPDQNCPPNSSQVGEYCYCDDGYAPDAAGQSCVPENEAPCPANAHRENGVCVCDDGYAGDPESPQGTCAPQAGNCGLFEVYNGSSCACIAGFVVDGNGQCVPGNNGCGNENWIGRCEDDQYTVYCDDQTDPNNPVIRVLDCFSEAGRVCGYNEQASYYDCIEAPPAPTCGAVPTEGQCNGSVLERCVGEQVVSTNCTTTGGSCHTFDVGAACVPDAWLCVPGSYVDADCDCGCGVADPTCGSTALDPASCDYTWCADDGSGNPAQGGTSSADNHGQCAPAGGDGDGDGDVTGDGDGDGDGDVTGDGDGDGDIGFDVDGGVAPLQPAVSGGAQSGCSSVEVPGSKLPGEALGLGLLVGLFVRRRRRGGASRA